MRSSVLGSVEAFTECVEPDDFAPDPHGRIPYLRACGQRYAYAGSGEIACESLRVSSMPDDACDVGEQILSIDAVADAVRESGEEVVPDVRGGRFGITV
jgi:hypothetical protein